MLRLPLYNFIIYADRFAMISLGSLCSLSTRRVLLRHVRTNTMRCVRRGQYNLKARHYV